MSVRPLHPETVERQAGTRIKLMLQETIQREDYQLLMLHAKPPFLLGAQVVTLVKHRLHSMQVQIERDGMRRITKLAQMWDQLTVGTLTNTKAPPSIMSMRENQLLVLHAKLKQMQVLPILNAQYSLYLQENIGLSLMPTLYTKYGMLVATNLVLH